ncbi:hypothetical protein F4777DRAFT_297499 [Nemania sp. FL0916]|nr:hypothetical protein F4777DRAFT_297499 [Nemania sp. FL0916]
MSFGFSVGDIIAGANLAHKLIRAMTETRGASIEYQEALAELCGIQQVFIQITQLTRNEMLPKSTLNALAQIIMPSMTIIADFLDRTKHYQTKLSREGGRLGSSWCKMGWALFRRDELQLLRDTLHARLSAINTLLAAANHLPSQSLPALPDSIAQFEVTENPIDYDNEFTDEAKAVAYIEDIPRQDIPVVVPSPTPSEYKPAVSPAPEQDQRPVETETIIKPAHETNAIAVRSTDGLTPTTISTNSNAAHGREHGNSEANDIVSMIKTIAKPAEELRVARSPQPSGRKSPYPVTQRTRAIPPASVKFTTKPTEAAQGKPQDLESYLHNLLQTAITIQVDAEAKAKAAQRAAEEAEWRRRMEESVRLKAEMEIRDRLNLESREAERMKAMTDQAIKEKLLEEAKKALESQEKAPIKFRDAVGRKFTFPFHKCRTWPVSRFQVLRGLKCIANEIFCAKDMEDLIKQAFVHVDIIGPHVQHGHYDLIGPNGNIILPQLWEKTIEPDSIITMQMWPMNLPGQVPGQPGPPPQFPMQQHATGGDPPPPLQFPMQQRATSGPPPSPHVYNVPPKVPKKKKKKSVGSFFSKKSRGLRRRSSTSSISSFGGSSCGSCGSCGSPSN